MDQLLTWQWCVLLSVLGASVIWASAWRARLRDSHQFAKEDFERRVALDERRIAEAKAEAAKERAEREAAAKRAQKVN